MPSARKTNLDFSFITAGMRLEITVAMAFLAFGADAGDFLEHGSHPVGDHGLNEDLDFPTAVEATRRRAAR